MIDWIVKNKDWIFSGVGITMVMAMVGIARAIMIRRRQPGKQPPPKQAEAELYDNAVAESRENQGKAFDHVFFLKRQDIFWPKFNKKVSYRYWACGTSLIGIIERELIQNYFSKPVRDIKLILPNTGLNYVSYEQLDKYNQFGHPYDQVKLAKDSFDRCRLIISQYTDKIDKHLRVYGGIMYSNITVFDDDAFIVFYNSTGMGDASPALYFNRIMNERAYRTVEEEFVRMWEKSDYDFGTKISKKQGTSMIFLNDADQVLLFLRDNKPTIPFPNCWDILGGHVQEGETPAETIVREIQEEIELNLHNPVPFKVFDMIDRIENTFWQRANLDISTQRLNEGQRLKWFTEDEIRAMSDDELAFGFRSVLLEFFRQRPFANNKPAWS